jgi:hypothetical protein
MKSRIMYIESKAGGLTGSSRIGRVTFSKSGATIYHQGKAFQSLRGGGFKYLDGVRVIAMDQFAIHKGHRHATVVVDARRAPGDPGLPHHNRTRWAGAR